MRTYYTTPNKLVARLQDAATAACSGMFVNNTLRLPCLPVKTKASWKVGVWNKYGNPPCVNNSDVWDDEAEARKACDALNLQQAITKMRAFSTLENADAERKQRLKAQQFSWMTGDTCPAIQ